jgi:alpha-D-ribose 1-methylphosphonate 5-triphosphate synthase subunit PhnI
MTFNFQRYVKTYLRERLIDIAEKITTGYCLTFAICLRKSISFCLSRALAKYHYQEKLTSS